MRFSIFGFIAAVASGLLAAAAFPPVEIPLLIWISLVPLMFALTRCRPLLAFAYTFVFCLIFHSGLFYWMFQLTGYTFQHHLLLGLLLSIWLGVAILAVNGVARRFGSLPALVSAPLAWVLYEWLRSNVGFMSLPWGLLAQSQYRQTILIQSADVAGTWGLTALIVAVNSVLTAFAYPALVKISCATAVPGQLPGRRGMMGFGLIVAALFLANLGYGYWAYRQPLEGRQIRVAAVQGNIEQHRKWDDTQKDQIMSIYESLSLAAGRRGTDLIIWPETATPRPISLDADTRRRVKSIAAQSQASILLGSAQVQKFKLDRPKDAQMVNSAYLLTPGLSRVQQRYDKIKLLPFGEYLPLETYVPWDRMGIPQLANFIPGLNAYVFFLKDFRFAVLICWENIFPQLTRVFVQNGAQFIINITNEAWFGKSAAPYQFLAMNVFRAVENRRTVVRCANTGISCIIDARGQVIDRVRDVAGNDIFVRGVLEGHVALNDELTLYTRWGDWFVGLSLAVFIMLLALCQYQRLRSHAQD